MFTREKEGKIVLPTAITFHSLFTRGDKRLLSLPSGINKVPILYSMAVRGKGGKKEVGKEGRNDGWKGGMNGRKESKEPFG